ncbi:MAG: glyoxalase [Synergistaceae bacterium]|nr:glyoxalase [Synergistaceae bacterium]
MKIECIAGYATITKNPAASAALFRDVLGLPLEGDEDYAHMQNFPVAGHFGVWSLAMAARSCFGKDEWPEGIPVPTSTVEFELPDVDALREAVREMQDKGYEFLHDARTEPWGQTVARFMSPEGVLVGLSYAPWLHEGE